MCAMNTLKQELQFHDLRSGPLERRAMHALAGCGFFENR